MEGSQSRKESVLNTLKSLGVSTTNVIASLKDLTPVAHGSRSSTLDLRSLPGSHPRQWGSRVVSYFSVGISAGGVEDQVGDLWFDQEIGFQSETRFFMHLQRTPTSPKVLEDRPFRSPAADKAAEVDNANTYDDKNRGNSSKDWIGKADSGRGSPSSSKVEASMPEIGLKPEILESISNDIKDLGYHIMETGNDGNESIGVSGEMQMKCMIEEVRHKEKMLKEKLEARTSELLHLEEELELLKAAAEMALDESHSNDFYIEKLSGQVDSTKSNFVELESQWNVLKMSLEGKKRNLEESVYATRPELNEKFQKLKEVELEADSILSEINKRKLEYSQLSAELKKQPQQASRRSYIERIKEITKNSRKQDADVERILKDTRELQLESNSIQERLHRTYAVADETIFREAKKDQVGRQAYRLLTSIHETFEQISEKILSTDRVRREVAEHEKKLSLMASRTKNIDKLQADLGAISKENQQLEQCLPQNSESHPL